MRSGISLALLASLLLIGAASWYRFNAAEEYRADLIVLSNQDDRTYQELLRSYVAQASSTPLQESLSATDLISRQLIGDYLNLALSGGASPTNIDALANQYVESVPTLSGTATISILDVETLANTVSNFKDYEHKLNDIHEAFANRVSGAYPGERNLEILGPALYSFLDLLSTSYEEAAVKLRGLVVPAALASSHVELINSYALNATALRSLAATEKDPAVAFAGLLAINQNIDRGEEILAEMDLILSKNGI